MDVTDARSGFGSGLRFAPCNYALVVSNLPVVSPQRLSHLRHVYSASANYWQLHIPAIFKARYVKTHVYVPDECGHQKYTVTERSFKKKKRCFVQGDLRVS